MEVLRRAGAAEEGMLLDVGLAIAGTGLTALALWVPQGLSGTAATPAWLIVVLSLMMGAPLALRRRAPLVMWAVIWAGAITQALTVHELPQGLEVVVLCAASYALGAYRSLRSSAVALVLAVPAMAISVLAGRWSRGAVLPFPQWFIIVVVALWLTGVGVRARRQATGLAARNAELQRQAEEAAAAERARIARELHDIVAHHLSVMVLQAAGARASGKDAGPALEKIERSGRQALAETRRLLGVLRDSQEDDGLAPQPGISDLAALADSVRAAGVPVTLAVHGDPAELPAAVSVSAYRIVQEALTNVLKHAGPARADVTVSCVDGAVTIEVADDGTAAPAIGPHTGGQGLAGMHERVAVFGGEMQAGPGPDGGFVVRARLPVGEMLPLGSGLLLGNGQL